MSALLCSFTSTGEGIEGAAGGRRGVVCVCAGEWGGGGDRAESPYSVHKTMTVIVILSA